MKQAILGISLLFFASCSPLKTSPNDEKHQLELTLHGIQTNLDDLRHDINCYQTELQILDGRIKYYENALASLKQNELEKQQIKLEQLMEQTQTFEKKWVVSDKTQKHNCKLIDELLSHSNETTSALTQFKTRINELEQELFSHHQRFDEMAKVKSVLDNLPKSLTKAVKSYRVRPGDTLEKIARVHKVSVDKVKQYNDLQQDLIVVGQELKIPIE